MSTTEPNPAEAPKMRDWSATLDLDRATAIKTFVERMEECMRAAIVAREDLKEVQTDAIEAEFSKRDVEAMKKVASLRIKDQVGRAREQLEALERIGRAMQMDLFGEVQAH